MEYSQEYSIIEMRNRDSHWSCSNSTTQSEFTMAFIPLFAFFLLFLLFPFALLLLPKIVSKKHYNLPPGPSQLPLIGNLHQLGELPHQSLHELSQKHGPLMYLKLGSIPTIVASSAEMAKEFLKTHDIHTCNRPLLTSLGKFSYGFSDIAFAPHGDQWRELRKMSNRHLFFSTKKLGLFRSVREEEAERMVRSVNSQIDNKSQVNLSEESLLISNNITCKSALGRTYYGEDPSDKGRLQEILHETQESLGAFFVRDHIPMLGWIDVVRGTTGRLAKNFREMNEFFQQLIEERRDPLWTVKDGNEDTVDTLLEIQKRDAELTNDHIKAILMNIFIGGSDTSSTIIEWVMTELIRHPEVMRKAQDEVRAQVGRRKKVKETDLEQLNYLRSVVKETMRLHPPVPLLLPKETIRHFKIKGYDIPAKSRLFINTWTIGRDTATWDSPEEFRPDRFADSPINFLGHDFELIPFGAGRRICSGLLAGMLVVDLALANLLYHFNWELPMGMSWKDIDMGEAPGLAAHRKIALHLMATKYDN